MKIEISYASAEYQNVQKYHVKTACEIGRFDKVIPYEEQDIDGDFKKKVGDVFKQCRGGGYWIWKPYIIRKTLQCASEGDYIFYCDAASYYVKSIEQLIDFQKKSNEDIVCFELPFLEKQWTKRDVFLFFDCDREEYVETNQRLATYILIKNTDVGRRFVDEWYFTALDAPYLFSNDENKLGKENYAGFIEHRHDQSVFSLLSKKYGFSGNRDISQFGIHPYLYGNIPNVSIRIKKYPKNNYPVVVALHRKKEINNKIRFRMWTQRMCTKRAYAVIWYCIGRYVYIKQLLHIKRK